MIWPWRKPDAAPDPVRDELKKLQLERVRLQRASVRARRQLMLSVHRAAEQNRLTNDWVAPQTSGDSEILADIPRVNARARQVARDDPYAKSIVRSFKRNIVGTGITASLDGRPYAADWRAWARDKHQVDIEGRRNLIAIQRWCVSELVIAGEAFVVRWIMGREGLRPPRLMLQCFEFEQLDRYKLEERTTGNEVRGGIEVDENGRPVAYHFYRRHPNDVRGLARPAPLMLESFRVPARYVSHYYDPERVRQTRGISRLAPVLRKIRDLSEYDATQLQVARAEASIGLLIKSTAMDEGGDATEPLQLDGLNVAYLDEGEDVTPFTPTRPGREYEPFTKTQLRAIAAGVGMSYEQLARDLTQTTYSGGRQGSIDDHREWEPLGMMLTEDVCQPVLDDWTHVWATNNPERSGDYFFSQNTEPVVWQGQGWEWVDPEAQGSAVERQMRLGLTSRTRELNKLGTNVAEIDRARAADGTLEIVKALGKADGREVPAPARPETTRLPEVAHAG